MRQTFQLIQLAAALILCGCSARSQPILGYIESPPLIPGQGVRQSLLHGEITSTFFGGDITLDNTMYRYPLHDDTLCTGPYDTRTNRHSTHPNHAACQLHIG